ENVQGFFHHLIGLIEGFSANRLWQIITALPLIYLFRAFQQPGVLFTTAEHTLTVLPHTVRQVWTMAAAERWLKAFVAIVVAGTFYYIFSPTSWPLILAYVIILTGINMLMTIPEWKFFQLHLFLKMLIVFGLLLLNTMHFVIDSAAVGIIAIVLLVMVNLLLLPRVFEKIDWKKVTAACDFKLWNMLIVSQATKIKFRKERQYSMWQRMFFWKKPFPYRKASAYHRLWHVYLENKFGILFRLLGALFLLLAVFVFLKQELFFLAAAIAIHVSTTFLASLFLDRLQADIVQVLPWDVDLFKKTFLRWAYAGSSPLLISLIIYSAMNVGIWTLFQWIAIISSFVFLLHAKLQKNVAEWNKEREQKWGMEPVGYVLLVMVIFSEMFQIVSAV